MMVRQTREEKLCYAEQWRSWRTMLQQQRACCTIGLIHRQHWMCRWCKRWWTTKKDKEREREREQWSGWDDSCIMGIRREASPGAQQVSDAAAWLTVRLVDWKHWAMANYYWLAGLAEVLFVWSPVLQINMWQQQVTWVCVLSRSQ